jgi:hypothetical protein
MLIGEAHRGGRGADGTGGRGRRRLEGGRGVPRIGELEEEEGGTIPRREEMGSSPIHIPL